MAKKIHAAAVIFENEHGEILVLKRRDNSPEGRTWGLVGGKVEAGEDPKTAAIREVQEEIGHVIDDLKLEFVKTYHWDRDDLDITFDVFKLPALTDDVAVALEEDKHSEHRWAKPADLRQAPDLMKGLYVIIEDNYSLIG
jgi:mutator protein MutT